MTLRSAALPMLLCSALLLTCGATLVVPSGAVRAEQRAKKPKPRKVSSWGQLGAPVKGTDFHEITYFKKTGSGPKAQVKKTKAFLRVDPKKTLIYEDAGLSVDQLAPEENVRIFGKPVSSRVPDRGMGRGGVDHQIQNARVVLGGDLQNKVPFDDEFVDPGAPDHKWLEAKVTKNTGGLWVTSMGTDHRVTLAQGAPVLKRLKVDAKRLRKGAYVQFFAYTTSDRPETGRKSDADRDSFRAAMLVILDRGSLASVYPMIWKR